MIYDYHSLAFFYVSRHDNDQALRYALEGFSIAKQHHSIYQVTILCSDLCEIYAEKNDFNKAYQYSQYNSLLKDSLYRTWYKRQMHEMAAKYQNEEQESKIEKEQFLRDGIAGGTAALALFSTIGFILYKRRRDALQKQQEAEQNLNIAETEMKALRAQMNPHFIFNSLNSIYNFVKRNDSVQAGEYITKFSKLMRLILENSRQREIPLSDDIETLKLYLELESLRLQHKFSFSIDVDQSINPDAVYIPPMMMQPFVENIIWHGFDGLENAGCIKIGINRENEYLVCEVEDNGIGRENADLNKDNHVSDKKVSHATIITEERINILNQMNKIKSSLQIIDLAQGVKILLLFPYIADQ